MLSTGRQRQFPRCESFPPHRGALLQLAVGLAAGLVCTYAFDRAFMGPVDSFLDLPIIGPAMALLIVMTLAASLAPIMRATRLDPVIALRKD